MLKGFLLEKVEDADFKNENSFHQFFITTAQKLQSIFLPQIKFLVVLHKLLHLNKNEGVDFKCNNRFFKYQSKTTQTRYFEFQVWEGLILYKTLQFQKFDSVKSMFNQ